MSGLASVYTTSRPLAVSLRPATDYEHCTNSNPMLQRKLYSFQRHGDRRCAYSVH
jgi:hypothetical protein